MRRAKVYFLIIVTFSCSVVLTGFRSGLGFWKAPISTALVPCSVLILDGGGTTTTAFQTLLNNNGMTATVVQSSISYAGTPSASSFAAVIPLSSVNYSTDMPAAGQTSIVNANAATTGVIFTEWASYKGFAAAQYNTLKNIMLATRVGGATLPLTFSLETASPIWNGVASSFTTSFPMGANLGSVINGGTQIASVSTGGTLYPGVVIKDNGAAGSRVVHIAHALDYQGANWLSDSNLSTMMVNAVKWAAHCP